MGCHDRGVERFEASTRDVIDFVCFEEWSRTSERNEGRGWLEGSLSVGWSVGQFWTLAGLTVSRAFQQLQRREREWERLRRYFQIKYLFSWSLIHNFGSKGLYKSLNQDYKVWSAFKVTEIWVFDMMYLCDRMVLDITFHVSCYYINPAVSSHFSLYPCPPPLLAVFPL